MNKKFIVRLWVDLEVEAETKKAAKEIANRVPVEVKTVPVYDMQVAEVYERD
jgi:hypothetical protein